MGQRRRRRAVAPTSNTASHDYHEKSSSRVSFGMVLRFVQFAIRRDWPNPTRLAALRAAGAPLIGNGTQQQRTPHNNGLNEQK